MATSGFVSILWMYVKLKYFIFQMLNEAVVFYKSRNK